MLVVDQRTHSSKMAECVNPSQSDAEQSPKSRPLHTPVMLPPCRICSEKASGFHYGANTCEACKVCLGVEHKIEKLNTVCGV